MYGVFFSLFLYNSHFHFSHGLYLFVCCFSSFFSLSFSRSPSYSLTCSRVHLPLFGIAIGILYAYVYGRNTHTHTRGWWQQIALRQHSTFQTNNKTTPPPHIAQHSVFELGQQFFGISEGSSGLSVLRTFRLLRILKLVRFMPNLRRQLFVMLRTMDNVAIFFSLLILFIFIFR